MAQQSSSSPRTTALGLKTLLSGSDARAADPLLEGAADLLVERLAGEPARIQALACAVRALLRRDAAAADAWRAAHEVLDLLLELLDPERTTAPAPTDEAQDRERRSVGPRLGELLMSTGEITQGQLALALVQQRLDGQRLGAILVEMGAIDEACYQRALRLQRAARRSSRN